MAACLNSLSGIIQYSSAVIPKTIGVINSQIDVTRPDLPRYPVKRENSNMKNVVGICFTSFSLIFIILSSEALIMSK